MVMLRKYQQEKPSFNIDTMIYVIVMIRKTNTKIPQNIGPLEYKPSSEYNQGYF